MSISLKLKNAVVLCGALLVVSACGVDDEHGGAQADAQHAKTSASLVDARESGAGVGVAQWNVSADVVQGISSDGKVVAEFVMHGDTRTVESVLPGIGSASLDADPEDASFDAETKAYYRAMVEDLLSAAEDADVLEPSDNGEADKAWWYQGCYSFYGDCDVAGFQGIYYGWWTYYECRYPTAVCGSLIALIVAN